jgi:uncharacterized membrane protein HdeD (DUF308 family)
MRHALVEGQRRQRPVWRWLRWIGILALMLGLVALGYEIATGFGTTPLVDVQNPLDGAYRIVYWPLWCCKSVFGLQQLQLLRA